MEDSLVIPPWAKIVVAAVVFAALAFGETVAPHFAGRRGRATHALRHFGIAALNALIAGAILGGIGVGLLHFDQDHSWGLLGWIGAPLWADTLLAIVFFDFWMYCWHRANHEIRFLWLFHRAHHTDPAMDASTALRFHPVEILFSSILRLAVIPLIGMTLWQLALYEALLLPVILFHHSNIDLPNRIDRPLRSLIVTPWMHWVHHSDIRRETDSNYSSLFSWCDRLGGTFRLRRDHRRIVFGLDRFRGEQWNRFTDFLKTPFVSGGPPE